MLNEGGVGKMTEIQALLEWAGSPTVGVILPPVITLFPGILQIRFVAIRTLGQLAHVLTQTASVNMFFDELRLISGRNSLENRKKNLSGLADEAEVAVGTGADQFHPRYVDFRRLRRQFLIALFIPTGDGVTVTAIIVIIINNAIVFDIAIRDIAPFVVVVVVVKRAVDEVIRVVVIGIHARVFVGVRRVASSVRMLSFL